MVPHEGYVLGPYVAEVAFPSHEDVMEEEKSENQLLLETTAKHLRLYQKWVSQTTLSQPYSV